MDIFNLEINAGSNVHYEQAFRIVLEDHLQYLKTHAETYVINVESIYAFKYAGDLSGLLLHYNIPVYLHWVIMRMNGFSSFTQMGEEAKDLLIPATNVIEQIRSVYKTKNRSIG